MDAIKCWGRWKEIDEGRWVGLLKWRKVGRTRMFRWRWSPKTDSLVVAQIFPTAQIFLELKFILGIQDEP